jgi:predicted TIM-barrel fold metal-dependent hydrolase
LINSGSQLAQQFWAEGKLRDCPVLIFHAHMHDAYGLFLPRKTPEGMLRSMDQTNTIMTFFCGHEALLIPSIGSQPDIVAVRKYPERFRSYYVVMARYLDPKADLKRMDENRDVFMGFKFHGDWFGVPITDPSQQPYWEYANEHHMLVLAHTWGKSPNDGPDQVAQILTKYPNVVIVGAHGFHDQWEAAPEIANSFPNYFFELTAVIDDRGPLDLFLERAKNGSRQVLFGTDLPWFSIHHGIGGVLSVDMTDDDRRNIFYRNGLLLLTRYDWFEPIWRKYGNGEKLNP